MTETEFDQTQNLTSHSEVTNLQITELIQTKTDTGDFSDTNPISEPDIDKLESDIYEPKTYMLATAHILDPPHSLHVKLIIINSLPPGLNSIEELVFDEKEEPIVSISEPPNISELLFRSLHLNPWYFTTLNFLGQGIPLYTTPYSTVPSFNWSMMTSRGTSSDTFIFSTSLESTWYGGFLPLGYHSLVGAYSRASS